MIREFDDNKDGVITLDEFLVMAASISSGGSEKSMFGGGGANAGALAAWLTAMESTDHDGINSDGTCTVFVNVGGLDADGGKAAVEALSGCTLRVAATYE